MTTIDKLGIMGIRSYGIDEETIIKFYKPLTILLGRNGSGKSTIIEAVRMATTGLLPPFLEKNGAAFIHDPRLDNETETKAKIRLQFTNVRGDEYLVSRHFRLTLKKPPRNAPGYKAEYRALDTTLKRYDAGNSGNSGKARAYRAADLNSLLPVVMRVSKPVLNNVIFVHQEDSLWPLSDPSTVKKRFDDIFAATRYTKALEVIRRYRNDQSRDLNTVNARLEHFEDKVKHLEAVRAEVEEIQVRHDELTRGAALLDREIADLQQQVSSASEMAREYTRLTSEMQKFHIKGEELERQKAEKYAELQVHLTDIDDDDIRKQIEDLQMKLDNAVEECSNTTRLIDELTADVDMKRGELTHRQTKKGMLEQQARMQRDRLEKLERLKNDVLSSRDLREQLLESGDRLQLPSRADNVERWSHALDDLLRDAEAYVKKLTEDGNNTLDAASAACTEVKIRLEAAKKEQERKLSSIDEHREKLTEIRRELRDLEQSQISIKDAEGRMKALENALSEKQRNGLIGSLETNIAEEKRKITSRREDLSNTRRTRDLLLQDQAEQANLDLARRAVKTSRIQLNSTMEELLETQMSAVRDIAELDQGSSALDALRTQITSVGAINDDNVTDKHPVLTDISTKILAKRDVLVKKSEREHAESLTELRSMESQKGDVEKAWSGFGSEVRDTKSEIQRVIQRLQNLRDPPEELKTLLESASHTVSSPVDSRPFGNEWFFDAKKGQDTLKTAISKAKQKVSQQETGLMLAIGDLEQFEEHPKHMCPACGMVSSKKVDAMRTNLQSRIEIYRDPAMLTLAKRCLEALEKSLEDIKRLDALTETARELNSKLTQASTEKVEVTRKFDNAKRTHARAERLLSKAKQLSGNSNTQQVFVKKLELNQLIQNLRRDQQEFDVLQTSLSVSGGDERSLADVDSQVRKYEEDLTSMQESLERAQKSLESEKDDLRRVEVRYHQAKQICLEQAAKSERHKGLVIKKEELTSSLRKLEKDVETERNACSTLQAELREAQDDFQRTRGENATLLEHATSKLSKRRTTTQSWAECQREMDAYIRSGKDKELETLGQSLEAITGEVASKTTELRKQERQLRTASDSRKDMEGNLRNLRDNQKYRLLEQELQANTRNKGYIQDSLDSLEREVGEIPADKVQRLTDQVMKKTGDQQATLGQRQVFTESYRDKRKELTKVESEGSRRKFDEFRIKKQTMQLASGDLNRYHRALDQALMAFHTLKMNSINRTIKELWQKTYRGLDIEEIEIISDHGDNTGGAVRRNFNYRVQMRQGGAALDMRGRCSAGQKVLACLVIRLALAENFCSDCGILALDEPTTNLDRENIRSLAEALRSLIELRRNQRNFQLVLITHDQEFIEMLGAREICNEFYTVYKDEAGVSRATLQDLQKIL